MEDNKADLKKIQNYRWNTLNNLTQSVNLKLNIYIQLNHPHRALINNFNILLFDWISYL